MLHSTILPLEIKIAHETKGPEQNFTERGTFKEEKEESQPTSGPNTTRDKHNLVYFTAQ